MVQRFLLFILEIHFNIFSSNIYFKDNITPNPVRPLGCTLPTQNIFETFDAGNLLCGDLYCTRYLKVLYILHNKTQSVHSSLFLLNSMQTVSLIRMQRVDQKKQHWLDGERKGGSSKC